MENNQYDEVLVRYLFNEETNEEKLFVENWINASEDNKRYFERLRKAWQLTEVKEALAKILDETNLDEKWNRFERNVTGQEGARIISINEQDQFDSEYLQENRQARKPGMYRLLIPAAIAASVILVIGLGWKFFAGDKTETPIAQNTEKKSDSLTFVVRHEVNTTGKEKRIQLADGSLIVLANKSEITYGEPFTNKREITLVGKAYFKVAHDKTTPFTVTSGDIATTALGTQFTVTAYKTNNQIIVRLYEGKVVVKAVDKSNKNLTNDVYLSPGQSFMYGDRITASVKEFKINTEAVPEERMEQEAPLDNPSLPQNVNGSYFMFNNQPLSQVFDNLAGLYNVNIVYDKRDVQNLYFIGKYNSSESLETILKRIATLNNLSVTRRDKAYIISK